jgi:type VI secretion system protein VasD
VNPDINGRPSPVIVRLYDLKNVAAFDSADFFSLWDRDQATLGQEMIARDEYPMAPNEQRKFEREPTDTAPLPYIGVVAAFRDIEHTRWRATFEVPRQKTTELLVTLSAGGISIKAASVGLNPANLPNLPNAPNLPAKPAAPALPHVDIPARP